MHDELEAARILAIRAGAILLEHYSELAVHWKERGNPVTEADRSASAFLVGKLNKLFPKDGILSEEEPDDPDRLSKSRVWIINPLDGTMEFIHHQGEFAVMIGLSIDGTASLGVIYQPTTEKLYYADSGSGAFVIENRETRLLQVTRESNPHSMTMALSRSHHSPNIDLVQHNLDIHDTVRCGSLGLKVGLICEGRAHLYLHTSRHTSQWDTCAPDVILHEAGGCMTDLWNGALRYNGPEVRNRRGVIASNGTIHNRIVDVAQSIMSERGTTW